eukprot:404-Prymnesium_polylepis.1
MEDVMHPGLYGRDSPVIVPTILCDPDGTEISLPRAAARCDDEDRCAPHPRGVVLDVASVRRHVFSSPPRLDHLHSDLWSAPSRSEVPRPLLPRLVGGSHIQPRMGWPHPVIYSWYHDMPKPIVATPHPTYPEPHTDEPAALIWSTSARSKHRACGDSSCLIVTQYELLHSSPVFQRKQI